MTIRNIVVLLSVVSVSGLLHAHAPELLPPGKRAYLLHLSKAASVQVKPGEYVDVTVSWGPPGHRVTESVLRNMLVVSVGSNKDAFYLDLAVDQMEAEKLVQAERMPQSKISVKVRRNAK